MGLGRVIEGTLHDCNKAYLERRLKQYDRQLYLKWNPNKNKGNGVWELRRKPDTKVRVIHGRVDGGTLSSLECVENDVINHILDVPVLTERLIDKLYEMDTYREDHYLHDIEYLEDRAKYKQQENEVRERKYLVRHFKSLFEQLREEARNL